MIYFWDTETALIAAGLLAPPLTCLTYCAEGSGTAALLNRHEAGQWLYDRLVAGDMLVGQNVAFDMAVMAAEFPFLLPLIFEAYDEDRVTDTMLRQQLADIADGKFSGYLDAKNVWRKREYSLAALSARLLGVQLEKDEWRLKYGQFRDVPIQEWPAGAREYPRRDAEATRDVYLVQESQWGLLLQDQFRQARAYWALHLSAAWGVHTDPVRVEDLRTKTQEALDDVKGDLMMAGLVREDGSRDTKLAKACMLEANPSARLTPTGQVALDEEACQISGVEILEDYALYSTLNKVLSTDVPMLLSGATTPLHTRYGMAETGRTTSGKNKATGGGGNLQNLRRLPGIRECITPRPGYVFAQADYSSYELFCLAQSCRDLVGYSALGDALNKGLDPHCVVAATILGRTYEDVIAHKKDPEVDAARQTGKVANFGFPGGLGAKRLVDFAHKGYGVTITEPEAKALKETWQQSWPEMRDFFQHVSSLETEYGYNVLLRRSMRVRGGASFCAAANTYFQGPAADGAKAALYLVAKECYLPGSAWYGSRIAVFVHDEIILESPEATAPEAAERLSVLMVQGARMFLPDMPGLKAEPCLMRYWSKNATTLRDDNGRLRVWG